MSGLILSDPLPRGWVIEKDTESVFSVFVPDAWWRLRESHQVGQTLHQMVTYEITDLLFTSRRSGVLERCRAFYDQARRGRVVKYEFSKGY